MKINCTDPQQSRYFVDSVTFGVRSKLRESPPGVLESAFWYPSNPFDLKNDSYALFVWEMAFGLRKSESFWIREPGYEQGRVLMHPARPIIRSVFP